MRNCQLVSTNSRVLGNRQDSRFVAGTQGGHAIALAHSIPAWRLYAAQAAYCAFGMECAMKQAFTRLVRATKRLTVGVSSPAPVVDRESDRPAPPASVGLV